MRRTFGLSLLTMAIAFGLTALANEKPTTEFQNIMKSNAATNGAMGLRAHIAAKDYDAIAKDAATFKENFEKVTDFFTKKKMDDAIKAFRNSIAYNGDVAERRSDLGEVLVGSAGGVVTSEAKAEFERAVAQNADDPKANYFLGLAAEQDGRNTDAASIWRAMLAKAPPDAPWRPLIQAALVRVGGPAAPVLSNDAMSAAKDMNETDRGAMIRGMVDRLATRLKQNGDDVEGWLRLVRAYMVMGERDKAVSALIDARQAVANDADRLRQLNEGLKNLGLDG